MLALLLLLGAACTESEPLYCDGTKPDCMSGYHCNFQLRRCEVNPDGWMGDAMVKDQKTPTEGTVDLPSTDSAMADGAKAEGSVPDAKVEGSR